MGRTVIAVVVVVFAVEAQAGTMTQTAGFHFAAHGGSGGQPYNQLNPGLAPLNAVVFSITVEGSANGFSGQGDLFVVSNNTFGTTLSFNTTVAGTFSSEAGGFSTRYTVPTTLGPGGSMDFTPIQIPPQGFQSTMVETTNLSLWVGTGTLTPIVGAFFESVTTDVPPPSQGPPLVSVTELSTFNFQGSETITYYYGSSFPPAPAPAPPSLVMLSLGLAAVAGLAWRQRKARSSEAAA
jgi:hypothetical protein